ncbi:PepSY-associated TM helix domain-containing protein [Sphingomonas sp. CFBP8993]|uniref:PepSY-associated TM helix domain-containing protein n=1 Tax=Sphingomonas sp. CFBP8993 TaxID=3096526 RepID=UPI002A69F712|nr:PepSY-associated TM helix domain-containing protein [Sphingomonas sp. CFBP8993]MDY0957726.1 PepSY-associated TM helix domain-containing protein [Sphingomonas sp. CFBP8993]
MAGITLRDTGLRVHRWLGLAVGLFAMALALSGTILACAPLIERIASPARYRISGEQRLPADRYADAAHRRLRPGERIAALSLEQGSSPVVVTLDRPSDRARRLLFLDPATAGILASAWQGGGMLGMLRRGHDGLFLSGAGRAIVGVIGIGLILVTVSGLWVQWRPQRKAKRRTDRAPRWHRIVGLWSTVPVLVMTASGVTLAFSGEVDSRVPVLPLTRPSLPVERVVASARPLAHGTLGMIAWPTERSPDWTLYYAGNTMSVVKVADDSAGAVAATGRAAPVMLTWVQRLHDGRGMSGTWGGVWRTVATLSGLAALWVVATGLIAGAIRPKVRRARR